ncbi:sulfotransferase [Aureitalea sp. L0-47]|nr:sulfotransferase [Aureitalea sp. L0-47]
MQRKVEFFVIGVARGGTTSLYNYLQQHPKIFLPRVKECNYFSEVDSVDKEAYETPDPGREYHMKIIGDKIVYRSLFDSAKPGQLMGEVSPSYLWDKRTAQRIHSYNPNAKILVSLRNPANRAHSHYLMNYQTGHDKSITFEHALEAPKKEIWGGGNMYLEMGLYYDQLKPYFDRFPSENIKVLISEDWTRRNGDALPEIFDFLGLEEITFEDNTNHNASKQLKNKGLLDLLRAEKIKKSIKWLLPEKAKDKLKNRLFYKEGEKEKISPETYNRLMEYFNEDIERTAQLTGIDLQAYWKKEMVV